MRTLTKLKKFEKDRKAIGASVRELRRSGKWSQQALAKELGVSQSRLSDIERGASSFTAEQFLAVLRLFNVSAGLLLDRQQDPTLGLQNALARLGAEHLLESTTVLPSEELDDLNRVIREALVDGSARVVTALAPVLVRHADRITWPRLHASLAELGRERRLGWLIANTLEALQQLRRRDPRRIAALRFTLELVRGVTNRQPDALPDIVDPTIRSRRTLELVQRSASSLSKEWGIVSALQPRDFQVALEAADADG